MVRKADNNEWISNDDLKELGVDSKKSSRKENNDSGKSNKKKNYNSNQNKKYNKHNNNNKRNNQHRKNNKRNNQPSQNTNSPIPTLGEWGNIKEEDAKSREKIEEVRHNMSEEDVSDKLSNIKVDLNNIEIFSDLNYNIKEENTDFILNSKPTYEVKLAQSAYIAHMKSLNFSEISSFTQSVGSEYSNLRRKYQIYFDKINTTSIGLDSFEDFIRITSMYDIPTLEFGIYNITFPGSTKFDITCGSCEKTMKNVEVDNSQLITIKDDKVYEHLNKNIRSITNEELMEKYSLLSKTKRILLEESKIVVDLRVPSLKDHLELTASLNGNLTEEERTKIEDIAYILLHLDNMLVPDVIHLNETGELRYIPIEDTNKLVETINDLHVNDGKKMLEEILDQSKKYEINYAIKPFKCRHCGEMTDTAQIDITQLLFQHILQ